jgi:hypothetical protein
VLLPDAGAAIIDPAKLHGYLLSKSHPVGRFKARFFEALGFSAERWPELEAALRSQHLTQPVESSEAGPFGQSSTIRANLTGPGGRSAFVRSVWFRAPHDAAPHFVTAYPGGET